MKKFIFNRRTVFSSIGLGAITGCADDVVAALPAMPGIDGDWPDVLQADLKTAIAA